MPAGSSSSGPDPPPYPHANGGGGSTAEGGSPSWLNGREDKGAPSGGSGEAGGAVAGLARHAEAGQHEELRPTSGGLGSSSSLSWRPPPPPQPTITGASGQSRLTK